MSSLVSLVTAGGPIGFGDPDGADVLVLQGALSAAGYRIGQDGHFGPRTQAVVKQFQEQHGLSADGVVGRQTAAKLDQPHEDLVAQAIPLTVSDPTLPTVKWPHDDTASLVSFYGKPWTEGSLLVQVELPFPMLYGTQLVHRVTFHRKGADALRGALDALWTQAGHDQHSPLLRHVTHWSGTYNYRPIRGSSRLSTHAFGAAIDFDAEHLPLGKNVPSSELPQEVVDAFRKRGFFWGGDYTGRKDSMHLQLAHE